MGIGLIENIALEQSIPQWQHDIRHAPPHSAVIVTSTFAAQLCVKHFADCPSHVKIVAVGPATAKCLNHLTSNVVIPQQHHSEGVLALDDWQTEHSYKVFLCKGEGGRDLLSTSLQGLGHQVEEFNLYRRQNMPIGEVDMRWQNEPIRCIVATSGEIIEAAFSIFTPSILRKTPWLVVSERTAKIAATLGVEKIHIGQGATDKALVEALTGILEQ